MFISDTFRLIKSIAKDSRNAPDVAQILSRADKPESLTRDDKSDIVSNVYMFFMSLSDWDIDDRFNETVKAFLYCVLFDNEVQNGGILQFFQNSSGDCSEETVTALHTLSAYKHEELLRKCFNFFPGAVVPKDRSKRNDAVKSINRAVFDDIDNEFFKSEKELCEYCFEYLINNKQSFLT